ncbi:methionyl aminopeptidase [Cristinia sonorae]|uniref:Methionine aminopeptidase n=1 Tax=Cristinia sonorae TaxID=1940300 RepID=A0A8K0UHQ2_9AGAR|nr:methionyl aminopeptidase [Cristinia sonorae]
MASGGGITTTDIETDSDADIQDLGIYDVILPPEPYIFGVSHITPRTVPVHILRPEYVQATRGDGAPYPPERYSGDGRIGLGTVEEVKLRAAARLAKKTLEYAGSLVKVGTTTDEIDSAVHQFIVSHSAYPSPLLYSGFPKSCCTSVNNIVTHGIPDDRPLQEGDIVNIDITVFLDGYHGDTSRMFAVGEVDETARSLLSTTSAALQAATLVCGPGKPFQGIARAIHDTIQARGGRWCVSPQFTGHGIGTAFHRPPWILHDLNHEPGVMLPGHCFTIEPCIIQGNDSSSWTFPDGWTASTINGARSAQEEDMLLITETGVDVLTRD